MTEQHAPAPEGWGWTLRKDSQMGSCMESGNELHAASKASSEVVAAKVKKDVLLGVHAERRVGLHPSYTAFIIVSLYSLTLKMYS